MNQNKRSNRGNSGRTKVVSIQTGTGMPLPVDINRIPSDEFTKYHGKTRDGNDVHSLSGITIGDTVIIAGGKMKTPRTPLNKAEVEVFCKGWLEQNCGASITFPNAAGTGQQ